MEYLGMSVRVAGIEFAPVITSQAGIATAAWASQPNTFRDDELSIAEKNPNEVDIYSHENDSPEDMTIMGMGSIFKGSFFGASQAQLMGLLGGTVTGGTYSKSGKKIPISTAVRITLQDGGTIIIPYAKGYVLFNANLGASKGLIKFPFQFSLLTRSDWDCDMVITPPVAP